jgi:hypothetical protein
MEPAPRNASDGEPSSTSHGERLYSDIVVQGRGRAQLGDSHYHGGQHTHNYGESPPCGAVRMELTGYSTNRDAEGCNIRINTLPWPKDPHFIGREDTLADMKDRLERQGCVALSGAGGIGY